MHRKCETCRFQFTDNDGTMTCRYNPPVGHLIYNDDGDMGIVGVFPSVNSAAFCHKWERVLIQGAH